MKAFVRLPASTVLSPHQPIVRMMCPPQLASLSPGPAKSLVPIQPLEEMLGHKLEAKSKYEKERLTRLLAQSQFVSCLG
jgi:hypothetical protein